MARKTGRFAARLKELRAAAKLSQSGLAKRSGIPLGTIQGFEVGRREPSFATLLKLAHGLGVSLAAFEMEVEPEEKPKPKPKRRKKPPR
jgi:transcriptional regulator with XRE-family HTH domain